MTIDDQSNRIAFLEETHAMLEREIEKALHEDTSDGILHTMKKRKLLIKDQITELKNKQGREFI
jgi:hypothetical protein